MKNICSLFLLFVLTVSLNAQSKKNIDIIYGMIEYSAVKIDSAFGKEKASANVKIDLPSALSILEPKVLKEFGEKNFKLGISDGNPTINYSISEISVKYPETFRDGIFGDYLAKREIELTWSYYSKGEKYLTDPVFVTFTNKDTVSYSEIPELENNILPFTQGKIPSPSILSNLLEPILIVGTIITTVILLFTVRSK